MNRKYIIISIIILSCISSLFFNPHKIVLKLGLFVGSNWDVPSGESYKVIDHAIERFEKQYPQVEIQYNSGILKSDYSSWLSNQIIKGEEPDVYMILGEDFNTLSSLGALKNLDSYIENDFDFDISKYYDSSLRNGIYQNSQFALPYESNPQLMFVNKTLLKKEGIDMPDNQWTLEDFYDICQKVTKDSDGDGVIDQYGCYNYDWYDSICSHGATLFNQEGTECYLSQEPVKNSLIFIQKLQALNQGHIISSVEFDNGHVAFSPKTFAQYRTYKPYPWRVKKYSTFEWDCIKMPSLLSNENSSEISTLLMGISSRTIHSKEAWEFLKMLTYNQQSQSELFQHSQGVSSLKNMNQILEKDKSIISGNEIDMNLLNEVMETTLHRTQFKKYESALTIADTRINEMIRNGEDIDISLMELQKELNQYLNE